MSDDNRIAIEYARLLGEAAANEIAFVLRWRDLVEKQTGARPTCSHTAALALAQMAVGVGRLG